MTAMPNPKDQRNWVMCRFCGWLMQPYPQGWACLWCGATAQHDGTNIWWHR